MSDTYNVKIKSYGLKKVSTIKAVRAINESLGLREAKDLVEAYGIVSSDVSMERAEEIQNLLAVSGAKVEIIPIETLPAPDKDSPQEQVLTDPKRDTGALRVQIKSCDNDRRLEAMQAVRELGLGFTPEEAKELVDTKGVISVGVSQARAEEIRNLLAEEGVEVEILDADAHEGRIVEPTVKVNLDDLRRGGRPRRRGRPKNIKQPKAEKPLPADKPKDKIEEPAVEVPQDDGREDSGPKRRTKRKGGRSSADEKQGNAPESKEEEPIDADSVDFVESLSKLPPETWENVEAAFLLLAGMEGKTSATSTGTRANVKIAESYLANKITAARVERANGYASRSSLDLGDDYEEPCQCLDEESAVSPVAYLADLLRYALEHIQKDGKEIDLDDLQRLTYQPLGELPACPEAVHTRVRQIRLVIEILRQYLKQDEGGQEKIEDALRAYLLPAYKSLLENLGTSHDENRLARTANREDRQRLASRLGISLRTQRPDELDQLLLGPLALNEETLEKMFGLPATGAYQAQTSNCLLGLDSEAKVATGATSIENTSWQQYVDSAGNLCGVFIDIDTSAAGFSSVPVYLTSLVGENLEGDQGQVNPIWELSGTSAIYKATKKGFSVYICFSDKRDLTVDMARRGKWHIRWLGIDDSVNAGRTEPGNTTWETYENGVTTWVDTSQAGLDGAPIYLASLGGKGYHWEALGATSVYPRNDKLGDPDTPGFRIYLRWSDRGEPELTPEFANEQQWHIQWVALSSGRLVGETPPGETEWKNLMVNGEINTSSIYADVNVRVAGFGMVPHYFTSLGGFGWHWGTTGITSICHPTPNGFRIHVRYSNGGDITPEDANARNWHVQWVGVEERFGSLLDFRQEHLRDLWSEQDWPNDPYATGRLPVIDPDLISLDDFRLPNPQKGILSIWKKRRTWVAEQLAEMAGIRQASLEMNDGGSINPDNLFTNLYKLMEQAVVYPAKKQKVKVISWETVQSSEFAELSEQLAAEQASGETATPTVIEEQLNLSVDAFKRLLELQEKHTIWLEDEKNESIADEEWYEVYSILVQAQKRSIFPYWVQEETEYKNVLLGPRSFWVSLSEPKEGSWPATFFTKSPLDHLDPDFVAVVDPDVFTLDDLPTHTTGALGSKLWHERRNTLDSFVEQLTEKVEDSKGLVELLLFALGLKASDLPSLQELDKGLKSGEPSEAADAILTITTQLYMPTEDFTRFLEIGEELGNSKGLATLSEDDSVEFLAILTRAHKFAILYPQWTKEQAKTPSYELLKARLPRWRASQSERRNWQTALRDRSQHPHIDPDILNLDNPEAPLLGEAALTRWGQRYDWIDNTVNGFEEQHLVHQDGELDWLDLTLESEIGVTPTEFEFLTEQVNAGEDISLRLAQLMLTRDSFAKLSRVRQFLSRQANVEDDEWAAVYSILTQVKKQRAFADWREEERTSDLTLSPDHFQAPEPAPFEFPIKEPEPPLPFRGSWRDYRDWQDTLEARIEQKASVANGLQEIISACEEEILPHLRKALVEATGQDSKWLSDHLLIDCQAGSCMETTRISQAIVALQNLLFSLRTGQLQDTFPDYTLDAEDFDEEWQWIGSYETWRAAIFVLLYPENVLMPHLKRRQTPGFRALVKELRDNRRLTSEGALTAAHRYEAYFRDVCNLKLEAAVTATMAGDEKPYVRTFAGDSELETAVTALEAAVTAGIGGEVTVVETAVTAGIGGEVTVTMAGDEKPHVHIFASSRENGSIYYSRYNTDENHADFPEYAHSFWELVPGLENVIKIIGAAAYTVSAETPKERFIYLFARVREGAKQQLVYTTFDLEKKEGWSGEINGLDLPEEASEFTVVVKQRNREDEPPHLAIRLPSGAVYARLLSRDGTGWSEEEDDWQPIVSWSKGSQFSDLHAMIEPNEFEPHSSDQSEFFLLATGDDNKLHYRLFGPRDNGKWRLVSNEENNLFQGAFALPDAHCIGGIARDKTWTIRAGGSCSIWIESINSDNSLENWLSEVLGVTLAQWKNWLNIASGSWSIEDPDLEPLFSARDIDDSLDTFPVFLQRIADYVQRSDGTKNTWSEKMQQLAVSFISDFFDSVEISDNNDYRDWKLADKTVQSFCGKSFVTVMANLLRGEPVEFRTRTDDQKENNRHAGDLSNILHGFGVTQENGKGYIIFNENEKNFLCAVIRDPDDTRLWIFISQDIQLSPMIPEGLSGLLREIRPPENSKELETQGKEIRIAYPQNAEAPLSVHTYLDEAWYFAPIQLAFQLQRAKQFIDALDWLRTVYDYDVEKEIFDFAQLEDDDASGDFRHLDDWLLDPLNPHAIASTRTNTYLRFTVMTIIRCLLEYADAEFTYDSPESLPRAHTLYDTAQDLLETDILRQSFNGCEEIIGELDILVQEEPTRRAVQALFMALPNERMMRTMAEKMKPVLASEKSPTEKVAAIQQVRSNAKSEMATRPTFAELFVQRKQIQGQAHEAALKNKMVAKTTNRISSGEIAGGWTMADYQGSKIPTVSFDFCIPPNPILRWLRLHPSLNLHKLRNCRNIAGVEREIPLYAAPTDTVSGMPVLGVDGQFGASGPVAPAATLYRYEVLIEQARQLAGQAMQIEGGFLAALEKRDAEYYNMMKARQEKHLAKAGIRIQDLRLKEAIDSVKLAEMQRDRAQIEVETYTGWIEGDISSAEQSALDRLEYAAYAHGDAIAGSRVAAALPGGFTAHGIWVYNPQGVASALASAASSTAAHLSTLSSHYQMLASFERRMQEWQLRQSLANQDLRIGKQQVTIGKDRYRIVKQERIISQMQADYAQDTAEFLATKFTNVELYDWMSGVLEGVYSFFLQQATATAKLAEDQLAFERQQASPNYIQADYWEPPSDDPLGGGALEESGPDRRGLTGSARLMQDITKLDQYRFETEQRKLQLTRTISLARTAPYEFQRFRETGILLFSTPMSLFDHDFPGHYLRLIKRVRTSVIALIPPTEGIKATLTTTGLSRIMSGTGGMYQEIVARRPPESVALSSPLNASGMFELTAAQPQEMLLPFEGMGVDTSWELRMPKAANMFDFNSIADMLLTIEYTALDSYDYRQFVIRELDNSISADRPFSFRQQFSDQWFDLHNPDQSPTPMTVRFRIRREDFPPNLTYLKMQHTVLYFARVDGSAFEIPVTALRFTGSDGAIRDCGGALTVDGIISTRRGNAGGWMQLIGESPVGEWELALPDRSDVRSWFQDEQIEDVLFVITYKGETPPWPE